jgi:hypothetical protein
VASPRLGPGRPDGQLDLLGGAFADDHGVLAPEVGGDGGVHVEAGHADGLGGDDAAERDAGDLGGAAADVDDQVAGGLVHRQAGPDGGGHRLLDQPGRPGPGLDGRLLDGPALHLGDSRGDADQHPRAAHPAAADPFQQHP